MGSRAVLHVLRCSPETNGPETQERFDLRIMISMRVCWLQRLAWMWPLWCDCACTQMHVVAQAISPCIPSQSCIGRMLICDRWPPYLSCTRTVIAKAGKALSGKACDYKCSTMALVHSQQRTRRWILQHHHGIDMSMKLSGGQVLQIG